MRLKYPDVIAATEVTCADHHPTVLRCHPIHRRGVLIEPFPTLFWLVCPTLHQRLSVLEASGKIREIMADLRADPALLKSLEQDHRAYIEERWQLMDPSEHQQIRSLGFEENLRTRGIGGMQNFDAVKCLHLHYAHHLARGNTVGRWLDDRGLVGTCTLP